MYRHQFCMYSIIWLKRSNTTHDWEWFIAPLKMVFWGMVYYCLNHITLCFFAAWRSDWTCNLLVKLLHSAMRRAARALRRAGRSGAKVPAGKEYRNPWETPVRICCLITNIYNHLYKHYKSCESLLITVNPDDSKIFQINSIGPGINKISLATGTPQQYSVRLERTQRSVEKSDHSPPGRWCWMWAHLPRSGKRTSPRFRRWSVSFFRCLIGFSLVGAFSDWDVCIYRLLGSD